MGLFQLFVVMFVGRIKGVRFENEWIVKFNLVKEFGDNDGVVSLA